MPLESETQIAFQLRIFAIFCVVLLPDPFCSAFLFFNLRSAARSVREIREVGAQSFFTD